MEAEIYFPDEKNLDEKADEGFAAYSILKNDRDIVSRRLVEMIDEGIRSVFNEVLGKNEG